MAFDKGTIAEALDCNKDAKSLKEAQLTQVEALSHDEYEEHEAPLKRRIRSHRDEISALELEEPANKRPRTRNGDIREEKPAVSDPAPSERALDNENGTGIVTVSDSYLLNCREPLGEDVPQHELPLAVIYPDSPGLLHENGSSNQKCSGNESNGSKIPKSDHVHEMDKAADVSDSSKLDIVSSDNGEVKMSFIFDFSGKSVIRMPSLDAVFEVVEEKFRKRYGNTDPEFSVKKLMKEFCEGFLKLGTDFIDNVHVPSVSKKSDAEVLIIDDDDNHQSNYNKPPSPSHGSVDNSHLPPVFDISKKPDAEALISDNDNHQSDSNKSPSPSHGSVPILDVSKKSGAEVLISDNDNYENNSRKEPSPSHGSVDNLHLSPVFDISKKPDAKVVISDNDIHQCDSNKHRSPSHGSVPIFDVSKKSDAEVLISDNDNYQNNSRKEPSPSHGSVDSQNIVENVPRVSKPIHVNGFNDTDVAVEHEKKSGVPDHGVQFSNSRSLKDDEQCHPPKTDIMYPDFLEDVTRGEESQPISLVNDRGILKLPKFLYISRNMVYNNAYVNFSLARISDHNCCSNCSGDCLSAPANCACTSETRGDFAYTPAGLLGEKFLDECITLSKGPKKDYMYYCENCPLENSPAKQKRKRSKKTCKGHLMRKFIKECWAKCGCSRNCGNRVVQRGITVKLQVFPTPQGKGWGLRTLQELEKGTFVCEYVGEIVTNEELGERNEERAGKEHTYPVLLDADWGSERHLDEEALCLDATVFGNVARFINHRCGDANLIDIPVEMETPDHHYYHLAFFTTRKVEENEELTWDYGIDFDDETHPIKAFKCKCGSLFCSKKNRS